LGPDYAEAQRTYIRAREAGMSHVRALILSHVGSRKDLWAFAREIARRVGCCIRTVQRALAEGASLGLVRCHRGKKDEVPPGANKPIPCGWSHRFIVGRGLGGAMLHAAISAARTRWMTRVVARQHVPAETRELAARLNDPKPPRRPPPGVSTLEWLKRELGELVERKSRDGP
jgi:hypothetical protein